MTTRGFRIFGVGVALGTATACSTLAPPPQAKLCESNDDCEQGEEICALDVGICIRSQHVPRRHLGLDIREPPELATQRYAFRSEVHGCDREVVLRSTPDQEYRVRKSNLVDHLAIELFEDPSDPTSLVSADIELTTVSRLATVRTEAQLVHPTLDEEDNLLATEVDWPHYHPSEMFQAEGFEAGVQILLKAAPDDGARAPVYRFVATPATDTNRPCTSRAECCPPSGCPDVRDECMDVGDGARECSQGGNRPWRYTFRYTDLCNRITTGSVLRVNEDSVEIGKVESALVRFLHARPDSDDNRVTIPVAAGPLPELVCTTDSDCVAGSQLCVISDGEASGHCELDLAGLDATFGSIETDPVGGFAAPLYSYCEGQASGDLTRSFTVSVQPPPEEADAPTVVPSGTFEFDQKFIPATEDSKPPTFLEGSLCLPDWGASTELDVRLQAAPAPVWGQGSDEWRCCDTSCLVGAVSEDEPIPTPPDPPLTCAGLSSSGPPLVTAEAGWSPADDAAWAATGCQPVKLDSRGHAGYLRRKGVCDEEGSSCLISRLGAGPSGAARPYTIRIEPPPGSLFASQVLTAVDVIVSGSTQPTNLERRVLVRGFVQLSPEVCDPSKDSDCDQVSALVMAERLWMPNADASNTPGPYFHTATTFTDPLTGTEGAYALPLDPGVWLVTALPFAGSRGGPAGIEILDLRNGMDRAKDFELRLGVRVNFKLEGFDPRTEVMPLDLGSWTGHDHPGRSGNLDLNAPGECLSTDSSQGCQIRRLLPLGALARPNAVNIVQITTREPAGDDGRCP